MTATVVAEITRGRVLQPCGTRAAWRRHIARGETPCDPCVAANRDYETARYDTDPYDKAAIVTAGTPLPGDWADQGACRAVDPNVFFPGRGEPATEAKTICAACPVITECAAYALQHPSLLGVWGGLTARQRQRRREGHAS